jgi:hypothetical protein
LTVAFTRSANLDHNSDHNFQRSGPRQFARAQWLKIEQLLLFNPEFFMPKKIRVEADICAPKPVPPNGYTTTTGRGQKVSLERGTSTRSKKNPGKRPKKGG